VTDKTEIDKPEVNTAANHLISRFSIEAKDFLCIFDTHDMILFINNIELMNVS